jgi:hypothetical protein
MRWIFAVMWAVAILALAAAAPSRAAPPTAVPSPGYDARLQESRAASRAPTYYEPVTPGPRPVLPRRTKRTHPR